MMDLGYIIACDYIPHTCIHSLRNKKLYIYTYKHTYTHAYHLHKWIKCCCKQCLDPILGFIKIRRPYLLRRIVSPLVRQHSLDLLACVKHIPLFAQMCAYVLWILNMYYNLLLVLHKLHDGLQLNNLYIYFHFKLSLDQSNTLEYMNP